MPQDEDQTARSFRFYFLAECRRRWWHALVAVGLAAVGVTLFKPLGVSDFVALGAVCLGVVTAVHVGGLSLTTREGGLARRLADLPKVERRRWFLAAMLFGTLTSVAIAAAATAPAIASLGRYQSIWKWTVEAPRSLALLVVGLSVVGFVCGQSWACCTRGWSGAPVIALFSTGLFYFIAWELPGLEYFPWGGRGFPAAASVLVGAAVIGWIAAAHRVMVVRPGAEAGRLRRVLPGVVLLAAGLVGFATQAGLAATYVARSASKTEFDDCLPSPNGRHVAVLTAIQYDEQRRRTEEPGSLVPAGLTNPWRPWVITDVRDGSLARLSGFSEDVHTSWSPDGRYFAYWVFETPKSLFLRLLFSRHLDWEWEGELLVGLHCYDTVTGSNKRLASGEVYGRPLGWSDASHIRWTSVHYSPGTMEAEVNEVDVETGLKGTRRIPVQWDGGRPLVDLRVRRVLIINRRWPSQDRSQSTTVQLVNLDTGSVATRPCRVEGRYVGGTLVSPRHAIVWAWDHDITTTQSASQPTADEFRVPDSRLIDIQSGRQISLRAAPQPGYNDFWVTRDSPSLARRWVLVIRHGLRLKEAVTSLLDLETGTILSRVEWPAPHTRQPGGTIITSPGEKHLLLVRFDGETDTSRFWTRPLGPAEAAFVAHDPTLPADARVSAPPLSTDVTWVNDREVVYVSQKRHLVFYDVEDRKRTRIVTLR